MKTNKIISYDQLKKLWVDFFNNYEHKHIKSANLLPKNDPTLLWINSGVAALKNYFLSQNDNINKRFVNVQKCVRTNDIKNIGITTRHNTFFEMMGYFSINSYFKKEAIKMAFEFLTDKKYLNISKNKLIITVYCKDEETYKIWQQYVPKKNIELLDSNQNFWNIGIGPCGPNTEIYYDRGKKYDISNKNRILLQKDIENNRFIEIWNIVFSEFNNIDNKNFIPLKTKNIDTGVGLERLLMIIENKNNNFETSIFTKNLKYLLSIVENTKLENKIKYIYQILDFSRTLLFISAEGVCPGGKKQEYIVRKLLCLHVFAMYKLNLKKTILTTLIENFITIYKKSYPEIISNIAIKTRKIYFNFEKTELLKYDRFYKADKLLDKINKLSIVHNHFFPLNEKLIHKNIFDSLPNIYKPFNKFKEFNTYGTWMPFLNSIIENYYYKLKIKPIENLHYSILMPPPNITGNLHIGHAYELYIIDFLIKKHKIMQYDVLLLSGMDHAAIATEIKIKNKLEQENKLITKQNIINEFDNWKIQYTNNIKQQWTEFGIPIDKNNISYTWDSKANKMVNYAFTTLYNDNLIYRKKQIINFDTKLNTVISDIEIDYKTENSKLYFIKYYYENSNKKEHIVIATTRPETILGDEAVFINPKDTRYINLLDKYVLNPITNKKLKIFTDKYVDMEFGTGILKCTPAHDKNDYKLALKYKLPINNIFNKNGIIKNIYNDFKNLHINDLRKIVVKFLSKNNKIEKIETIKNNVGYSQRTNTIIQPMVSLQWFIKAKLLAKPLLKSISKNKLLFVPKNQEKKYELWLKNIHDWCISRQINIGHKIPVWYKTNKKEKIVNIGSNNDKNLFQETDVLDTWFSSALWPLICLNFDPLNKNNELFKKYYPINNLITGYDILFFWVCKMNLICYHLINKYNIDFNLSVSPIPFKKVYLHGLLRDKNNLKFSKSNNNTLNPQTLINEYSNDQLRYFLLNNTFGQDIKINTNKIKELSSLKIKLENVTNFIKMNIDTFFNDIKIKDFELKNYKSDNFIFDYCVTKFELFTIKLKKNLFNVNQYDSLFDKKIFNIQLDFFWKQFCGKIIEVCKIFLKNNNNSLKSKQTLLFLLCSYFLEILILLNPYLPTLTYNIFYYLTSKNLYEQTYLFNPKIYFNIGINGIRNFYTNKIDPIYINTITVKNFLFGKNINKELWNDIKNIVNKSNDDFPLKFIVRSKLKYTKANINFLNFYLQSLGLKEDKFKIIYLYQIDKFEVISNFHVNIYDFKTQCGSMFWVYMCCNKSLINLISNKIDKAQDLIKKEIDFLNAKEKKFKYLIKNKTNNIKLEEKILINLNKVKEKKNNMLNNYNYFSNIQNEILNRKKENIN